MNPRKQPLACLVLVSLLLMLILTGRAWGTTFTLMNACSYAVWPGIQADAQTPTLETGGLTLAPGQSVILNMPSGWSGRLWGRTGCSFNSTTGAGFCATGDCGGVLHCNGAGGSPPVTLAEFTLGATDFYDVSLVDGYNLPLTITSAGGAGDCAMAGCATDLNSACPRQLQMDSGGQVVACRSACDAFASPQYCCTGAFDNPNTCNPSFYSRFFKTACPAAYSYAYDDPSSTFTCTGATGYTITFCPHSSP